MDLFLEKKFSAAIEEFRAQINTLEEKRRKRGNEDDDYEEEGMESEKRSLLELAVLHCNVASAELEMGLFRNCIKSCSTAEKCDASNIKAQHIEGKAYFAMGKKKHAESAWQRGIDKINDFCDAELAVTLVNCMSLLKEKDLAIKKTPDSAEEAPCQSRETGVDVLHSHSALASPPLPPPPPLQEPVANEATKAFAALGGKERKVGMEQLKIIENHFIGSRPNQIKPTVIQIARKTLAHACGEDTVDNLISMGYLLVNNNKHAEACELFITLLKYRDNLVAAYMGLGSSWALSNRMNEAVEAFSKAIKFDPTCADAWKRRGQTNAAANNLEQALLDLHQALSLGSDKDIYYHIGTTLHSQKRFAAALGYFIAYQKKGGSPFGKLLNFMGMCYSQLGDVDLALEHFDKALSLDPSLVEALLNHSQMLKENGQGQEAEAYFEKTMRWFQDKSLNDKSELETSEKSALYFQTFKYRADLHYAMGNYMDSLGYLRRYLGVSVSGGVNQMEDSDKSQALVRTALCMQNLGQFSQALNHFDSALEIMPNHTCRVQRSLLLYYLEHINESMDAFSVDNDFNSNWKEAFCKYDDLRPHEIPFKSIKRKPIDELDPSFQTSAQLEKLLQISRGLSGWVQLDTPGFLPNKRQHASFGLAVLAMSKKLSQHVQLIASECKCLRDVESLDMTGMGLRVPNSGASEASKDRSGTHIFNHRDLFDIAVKWRQISEPNDAVWWIDRLSKKAFEDGFGLHTPMVNGELKCIRYYPYFEQGFSLLIKILTEDKGVYFTLTGGENCLELSSSQKNIVSKASSLKDIYNVIGDDFWVVCPCLSSVHHREVLQGTRLTLCKRFPEGYDFSIRSPSLPSRWAAMNEEIAASFQLIVRQLVLLKKLDQIAQKSQEQESLHVSTGHNIKRSALRLFYYWVNFAPLTRGSAMCGYVAVLAVIVASNRTVTSKLPKGKQLDWEAIFTQNPDEFINSFEDSLILKKIDFSLDTEVDMDSALPSLYFVLQALNQ